MKVIRTLAFEIWLPTEPPKVAALIESRVYRIERYDHFGDVRYLGRGLSELRWKLGLRVYFLRATERTVLFLIGGFKNAQQKDIQKARLLIQRHTNLQAKAR